MGQEERLKILEENYSDLEMDNIRLMYELEKAKEEIERLAKIIFLYGHGNLAVFLGDKKTINFIYDNYEYFKDMDLDYVSFDLNMFAKDLSKYKTVEELRKAIYG